MLKSPPVTSSRGSEIWRIADALAMSPPVLHGPDHPLDIDRRQRVISGEVIGGSGQGRTGGRCNRGLAQRDGIGADRRDRDNNRVLGDSG